MAYNESIIANIDADYAGGDYDSVRGVDLTGCMKAALDSPDCRAFTYNPSGVNNDGYPVCWLKSRVGSMSSVNPSQNVVAGRVEGR